MPEPRTAAPVQPDFTLASDQVAAYLRRIGAPQPKQPDAAELRHLVAAHVQTVPFENLDVHARMPISPTDLPRLYAKVVENRRGGFCYELNGLFAAVLAAVGFRVTIVAARVWGAGAFGPLFDHMALKVADRAGAAWLVDVGFGRFAGAPLAWTSRAPQADRFGQYLLQDVPPGELESSVPSVDVLRDGAPQYRVEDAPRPRGEFAPTCWYHSTAPASPLTMSLICSRATPTGRVSLAGRRLIVSVDAEGSEAARRDETELANERQVLEAYREHFGIELAEEPHALNPREGAPFLA